MTCRVLPSLAAAAFLVGLVALWSSDSLSQSWTRTSRGPVLPSNRQVRRAVPRHHHADVQPQPEPLLPPASSAPAVPPAEPPRQESRLEWPPALALLSGALSFLALALVRPFRSRPYAMLAWSGGRHAPRPGCHHRSLLCHANSLAPLSPPSIPRTVTRRATEDDEVQAEQRLMREPKPQPQPEPPMKVAVFLYNILELCPHLFEETVQVMLRWLCHDYDAKRQALPIPWSGEETPEERPQEEEASHSPWRRLQLDEHSLGDLLYFSVRREFTKAGIGIIKRTQLTQTVEFAQLNMDRILPCIHSPEELEVVQAHLKYVLEHMQLDADLLGDTAIRICKYDTFKLFVSMLLFGYFLRHTHTRFALACSAGLAPRMLSLAEQRAMLQEVYDDSPDGPDPDSALPLPEPRNSRGRAMTLKEYIDSLDGQECCHVIPLPCADVMRDYVEALFGDVDILVEQIRAVVNEPTPAASPEEYVARMVEAAELNAVDTLDIRIADLRRLLSEAVVFGTFLKNAESLVELSVDRPLLHPHSGTL